MPACSHVFAQPTIHSFACVQMDEIQRTCTNTFGMPRCVCVAKRFFMFSTTELEAELKKLMASLPAEEQVRCMHLLVLDLR